RNKKLMIIKTLTRIVGISAALLVTPAHAQLWSRSESRHTAPAKTQTPGIQEINAHQPKKPEEPAASAQPPPPSEPQIIKETRIYEQTLRDLAEKAEQIVQRVPDKPDELACNFGELHDV